MDDNDQKRNEIILSFFIGIQIIDISESEPMYRHDLKRLTYIDDIELGHTTESKLKVLILFSFVSILTRLYDSAQYYKLNTHLSMYG